MAISLKERNANNAATIARQAADKYVGSDYVARAYNIVLDVLNVTGGNRNEDYTLMLEWLAANANFARESDGRIYDKLIAEFANEQ